MTAAGRRLAGGVLAAGLVGGIVIAGVAPPSAGQQAGLAPVVHGAVQVTSNPDTVRAHSSPQLARNPRTGELVVVESDVRGDLRCSVHVSADDGRSWFRGGELMSEPHTECSRVAINGPYATVAFDPQGVVYVAFMATDPTLVGTVPRADIPIHLYVARSTDGGRSFTTALAYDPPEGGTDTGLTGNTRPMVAVDPTDPSHVYLAWLQRGKTDEKAKAMIAASADGGRTFGEPVDLSGDDGGYQPRPAVGPDGTVHAIFPGAGFDPDRSPFEVPRPIYYRRSADHGQTWSDVREIDQGNAGFYGGRKHLLAVDRNSGNLYAVWYGNANVEFDPRMEDVDIFLRVSTDGGQTWSERRTVNDDADRDLVNHYDPGIAIAPNGRVDIAWYDFRNSPYPEQFPEDFQAPFNYGGFQDVYYTWSTDGGRTFHPNVRVTDRIINREIGVWSNNIHSHMSLGIASSNDGVYLAWQDTRNGTPTNDAEDVYMASVMHSPEPRRGTSPWVLAGISGASLVLGMGLAMALAAWITRARRASR